MSYANRQISPEKHSEVQSARAFIASEVCKEYGVNNLSYIPRRSQFAAYGWSEEQIDHYQDLYQAACAEFSRRCIKAKLLSPPKKTSKKKDVQTP